MVRAPTIDRAFARQKHSGADRPPGPRSRGVATALEIDPLRGRLFELFVMADAADLVKEPKPGEPPENDLTAEVLCRNLAAQWNLTDAARESFASKTRLQPEHLSRMRLLWSVMRMWMEWTYAWQRWREFHQDQGGAPLQPGAA